MQQLLSARFQGYPHKSSATHRCQSQVELPAQLTFGTVLSVTAAPFEGLSLSGPSTRIVRIPEILWLSFYVRSLHIPRCISLIDTAQVESLTLNRLLGYLGSQHCRGTLGSGPSQVIGPHSLTLCLFVKTKFDAGVSLSVLDPLELRHPQRT